LAEYLNGMVEVLTGDITLVEADAVVNAANSTLMGGGGVDGAIHHAGGPAIMDACKAIRAERYPDGLPTGQAVATTAGNLPATYVIHTVGPVWSGGGNNEERLLGDCYHNPLIVAREHGCPTVAFPAVSTGVYGFPKDRAARIASETVRLYLETDDSIKRVFFIFFGEEDKGIFEKNQRF
jgi:O-acetyl-ADP-ribose deacetylase